MRLATGIALALLAAACGQDDSAEQQADASANDVAVITGGNDVTAIDAASGADANMAADVEIDIDQNLLNQLENETAGNRD